MSINSNSCLLCLLKPWLHWCNDRWKKWIKYKLLLDNQTEKESLKERISCVMKTYCKKPLKWWHIWVFLKSHLKASEGTDSFYNSELLLPNPKCFSFREFGPKFKPEGVPLTSVFFVIPKTDQSALSSVNPLPEQTRNMREVLANPGGCTDCYF